MDFLAKMFAGERARPAGSTVAASDGLRMRGCLRVRAGGIIGASIEGDIIAEDAIELDAAARVKGHVTAAECRVAGSVEGGLTVTGKLVLAKGCLVEGPCRASALEIEPGARFAGVLHLEPAPP